MKNLINISGGAIKFIALISALDSLLKKGVVPKNISGVSSGAIIAFLYSCDKIEEGYEMAKRSYDKRIIFSWKNDPTGKKGGFSLQAIFKLLRGKNYVGIMDNLEKNLRKICTATDFYKYKRDVTKPNCYILAIEERTGKHLCLNLKDLDYEEAIDMVIASSTIAPTIKSRLVQGKPCNDGGHRGHSAGAYLLATNKNNIKRGLKEVISIYSRDEPKTYDNKKIGKTSTFFNRLLNFTIGVSIKETSLNDEFAEQSFCKEKGISYSPIYLEPFTDDTYIISKDEITKGIAIGTKAVDLYYKSK